MRLAALRNRKTALVAGVAVVGLPLAFFAQSDAAVGTSQSTVTTFTLVEQPVSSHFVDLPPMQKKQNTVSAGDEVIFVNKLMQGSAVVGNLHAICAVTRPATKRTTVLCNGSFRLKGGQLTVTTATVFTASTITIAITGGTGKYEGAGGQITAVNHPDGSSTDSFHVILP